MTRRRFCSLVDMDLDEDFIGCVVIVGFWDGAKVVSSDFKGTLVGRKDKVSQRLLHYVAIRQHIKKQVCLYIPRVIARVVYC
jgi:hypothetical protein